MSSSFQGWEPGVNGPGGYKQTRAAWDGQTNAAWDSHQTSATWDGQTGAAWDQASNDFHFAQGQGMPQSQYGQSYVPPQQGAYPPPYSAPYGQLPYPAPNYWPVVSDKSRLVAFLLAFFLGALGVHRFYVGKIGTGLLWLFTLGFLGIGSLIDIIVIACGGFRDVYGRPVLRWGD